MRHTASIVFRRTPRRPRASAAPILAATARGDSAEIESDARRRPRSGREPPRPAARPPSSGKAPAPVRPRDIPLHAPRPPRLAHAVTHRGTPTRPRDPCLASSGCASHAARGTRPRARGARPRSRPGKPPGTPTLPHPSAAAPAVSTPTVPTASARSPHDRPGSARRPCTTQVGPSFTGRIDTRSARAPHRPGRPAAFPGAVPAALRPPPGPPQVPPPRAPPPPFLLTRAPRRPETLPVVARPLGRRRWPSERSAVFERPYPRTLRCGRPAAGRRDFPPPAPDRGRIRRVTTTATGLRDRREAGSIASTPAAGHRLDRAPTSVRAAAPSTRSLVTSRSPRLPCSSLPCPPRYPVQRRWSTRAGPSVRNGARQAGVRGAVDKTTSARHPLRPGVARGLTPLPPAG